MRLQRIFTILTFMVCAGLAWNVPAKATLILDTGPGTFTTMRASDSGPGQGVAANQNVTITQMAMDLNLPNGGDIKYMIWDVTNTTLLYSQILTIAPSSTPTFVLSNPFSFNLSAGQTYYFGVIADNNLTVSAFFPAETLSENGLTLVNPNSNYANFSSPTFSSFGAASITLQLYSGTTTVTPEPASCALLAGALGILALRMAFLSSKTEPRP